MAGDWIKFEVATLDKPEVADMADALGLEDDAVVGKLLRVWAWADEHCHADGVTSVTLMSRLDRRVGVTGFCAAMQKVGWLEVEGETVRFPNFDRHNGNPAKSRVLAAERKRRSRSKRDTGHGDSVTKAGPEKRREEKSNRERDYPTLAQAREAGKQLMLTEDQVDQWWNTREASGWRKGAAGGGTQTIENWRADLAASRGWLKEQSAKGATKDHRAEKRAAEYEEQDTDLPMIKV